MAVFAFRVAVNDTTAVPLLDDLDLDRRYHLFLLTEGQGENGTPYVFIGGETVTEDDGWPVQAFGAFAGEDITTKGIEARGQVYAICQSGTTASDGYVRVLAIEVD